MTERDELIERVRDAIKSRWNEPDDRHNDHYEGDAIAAIRAVREFDCERGPSEAEIEAAREATWASMYITNATVAESLRVAADVRAKGNVEQDGE